MIYKFYVVLKDAIQFNPGVQEDPVPLLLWDAVI